MSLVPPKQTENTKTHSPSRERKLDRMTTPRRSGEDQTPSATRFHPVHSFPHRPHLIHHPSMAISHASKPSKPPMEPLPSSSPHMSPPVDVAGRWCPHAPRFNEPGRLPCPHPAPINASAARPSIEQAIKAKQAAELKVEDLPAPANLPPWLRPSPSAPLHRP